MTVQQKMDFIDLKTQQQQIYPALMKNIQRVLEHGQYIMGPEIKELEDRLADFVGVKQVISCSSGTDALLIPLMAYGVGPGDAIFTTPFTFISTAEVIQLLGATPIFVDIHPRTFNIDPQALEMAIANSPPSLTPRGIITVDLFGLPAEYSAIKAIAQKHGLFALEDAAQAFGATYQGNPACSLTEVGATSFFPAKPLGGYGDGGAIFTDDDGLAEVMRSIRVHGQGSHKYDNVRIGVNGRLDTLQAAILLAKLDVFPQEVKARQEVAQRYGEALHSLVEVPYVPPDCTSVWAQFSVLTDNRSLYQEKLRRADIPSVVYYPTPLHLQTAFRHLGHKPGDYPVSEKVSERIFSLPMHPYLTPEMQQRIIDVLLG